MGDTQTISFNLGSTIMPVVIANREPMKVWIAGGERINVVSPPLQPPVKSSIFDNMPKSLRRWFGAGEDVGRMAEARLYKSGAGSAGAGTGGLTAAIAAKGLLAIKESFIDPLVGMAQTGFQSGISNGMAAETFGKTFEVVGNTLGTMFLPTVLHASVQVLLFGETLKRYSAEINGLIDYSGNVAGDAQRSTNPLGKIRNLLDGLEDLTRKTGLETEGNGRSTMGRAVDYAAEGLGITETKDMLRRQLGYKETKLWSKPEKSAEMKWLEILVARLEQQQGAKPQYSELTEVRRQAQLAALGVDPLETKMKQEIKQAIDDIKRNIEQINGNTKPG